MITLHERGVWLVGGAPADAFDVPAAEARKRTMAWRILQAHNRSGDPEKQCICTLASGSVPPPAAGLSGNHAFRSSMNAPSSFSMSMVS